MYIPCLWVLTTHPPTAKCHRGVERKICREKLQQIKRAGEILFLVGDKLLETV